MLVQTGLLDPSGVPAFGEEQAGRLLGLLLTDRSLRATRSKWSSVRPTLMTTAAHC